MNGEWSEVGGEMDSDDLIQDGLLKKQAEIMQDGDVLAGRIQKVLDIHTRELGETVCFECGMGWPCLTRRVLTGGMDRKESRVKSDG